MSVFSFLVAFFLIQYLQITLHTAVRLPAWHKKLVFARYAAIALLCVDALAPVVRLSGVTRWLWHLFLTGLVVVPYRREEFRPARTALLTVVPYIVLELLEDVLKAALPDLHAQWKVYLSSAQLFAVILIIIMWINSRKQQKALENEQLKRQQEVENNRIIAAQNTELERLVTERTAEISQQKDQLQEALT